MFQSTHVDNSIAFLLQSDRDRKSVFFQMSDEENTKTRSVKKEMSKKILTARKSKQYNYGSNRTTKF